MELERYPDNQPARLDPATQQLIAQLRESGHSGPIYLTPPAPVRAPEQFQPQSRDQSGLIGVMFLCLVLMAMFFGLLITCHATPIVNETHVAPANCHWMCGS